MCPSCARIAYDILSVVFYQSQPFIILWVHLDCFTVWLRTMDKVADGFGELCSGLIYEMGAKQKKEIFISFCCSTYQQ